MPSVHANNVSPSELLATTGYFRLRGTPGAAMGVEILLVPGWTMPNQVCFSVSHAARIPFGAWANDSELMTQAPMFQCEMSVPVKVRPWSVELSNQMSRLTTWSAERNIT